MEKNKMKTKLEELLQIQESRIDKMRLNHVKVTVVGSGQFYATLKITNEEIIIRPDDEDRLPMAFYDCHLNGVHEIGTNGLQLVPRGGRPPIKIFFRTGKQLGSALKRVQRIIGSESTADSSTLGSSSSAIN